ncbi:MAG: two-component regulator propeller domain-containing protein [Bacteroidota bacterium]
MLRNKVLWYRWLLILPFYWFVSFTSWGQSYNFVRYDVEEGLAHSHVMNMCEDQFGNLWFATQGGGLSKFNGITFENYTEREGLSSNFVRDVIADQKGNIWAATANGVSLFDGKTIRNFGTDQSNSSLNSVNTIFEDQNGLIWYSAPKGGMATVNTQGQINTYNADNGFVNDKVIDITEDNNGNLWIVTAVKGLYKFRDGVFTHMLGSKQIRAFILSIYIGESDTMWVGTNRGLMRYAPGTENEFEFIDGLNEVFVKKVLEEKNGNIWVVSTIGVVAIIGDRRMSYNKSNGFTDLSVHTLFRDREGSLWFATSGEGIFKFQGEIFYHIGEQDGLTNKNVTSIVKDRTGFYWFGTDGGGLIRYDGYSFEQFSTENGLPNNYITSSVMDASGQLWFGTKGAGLINYNGDAFNIITQADGLVSDAVKCLYADDKNNVWVGTQSGLSILSNGTFKNFTLEDGLFDKTVWKITPLNDGSTLVVTRAGFNTCDGNNLKPYFYDEEIFDKRINIAIQDKLDNLWIGYSGYGIAKINKETKAFQSFTTVDGLSSNLIYNLTFDNNHNLIVSSERGVDRIILDSLSNVQNIKNYERKDGFFTIQTNYNSVYKELDGSIWFGSNDGVYKYQPYKESVNEIEPKIYLSGLRLFYNEVNWSEYADSVSHWYDLPQNLNLKYNENNLVFEYFGNSHKNPKKVEYQFMLEGFEPRWSPVTKNTEAVYTNLSPGNYTFKVRASNSDGIWNTVPASFSFSIIPPFWQRPWFYVLSVVVALLLVKFYNDYRIKAKLQRVLTIEKIRAEELQKVRTKMARDFHDNMGNQLASITVFTNLINLKLKDKSKEIDELLKNIEKHTKSLFNGTKDFIWSIDPESDYLSELFTYLKDFGEDLFAQTSVHFYSSAGDIPEDEAVLPSGWSRQIVLIFKEAMTNALKHSGGDETSFNLNLLGDEFVMEFKDNGTGFANGHTEKGHGFTNMRSRAKQIGCELTIENRNENKGVAVTLRGKIEKPSKSEVMRFI